MALYAIGDVQGCYRALRALFAEIDFHPTRDRLWFTGDLVNRGAQSADVARCVADLGDRAVVVLGNHDLHLLAVASGVTKLRSDDTFTDILESGDSEHLLTWLRTRPLLHRDNARGWTLVHAGLLPQWDMAEAMACAREVEDLLIGHRFTDVLEHMYGDMPERWSPKLKGWDRVRLIVNAFTRLRFCHPDGRADFRYKGAPGEQPPPLIPWFQVPGRRTQMQRVVFGHWSTLGLHDHDGVLGIDTGCFWGGRLTAVRLDAEPRCYFAVAGSP